MAKSADTWDTLSVVLDMTPCWYEGTRTARRKRLEVRYVTHRGTRRIDIRKWYVADDQTWRPGREGVTLPYSLQSRLWPVLARSGQRLSGVMAEAHRTLAARAEACGACWTPFREGDELVLVPAGSVPEVGRGLAL